MVVLRVIYLGQCCGIKIMSLIFSQFYIEEKIFEGIVYYLIIVDFRFYCVLGIDLYFLNYFFLVFGRSSVYGDVIVEGYSVGLGSVSLSIGVISIIIGYQEGDGFEGEGEGEGEGDVYVSNRLGFSYFRLRRFFRGYFRNRMMDQLREVEQ